MRNRRRCFVAHAEVGTLRRLIGAGAAGVVARTGHLIRDGIKGMIMYTQRAPIANPLSRLFSTTGPSYP